MSDAKSKSKQMARGQPSWFLLDWLRGTASDWPLVLGSQTQWPYGLRYPNKSEVKVNRRKQRYIDVKLGQQFRVSLLLLKTYHHIKVWQDIGARGDQQGGSRGKASANQRHVVGALGSLGALGQRNAEDGLQSRQSR